MAQSMPNTFRDTAARAVRVGEVPGASFVNGVNNSSCAPGVGVSIGQPDLDPGVDGQGARQSWTLLDQGDPTGSVDPQIPAVRVPQASQSIGGEGLNAGTEGPGVEFIIGASNPTQAAVDGDSDLGGTVTVNGTANLQTLAVGWITL
jgi:hypothetical protein